MAKSKASKPTLGRGKPVGLARPGGVQKVGKLPADKAGKVARPGGAQGVRGS